MYERFEELLKEKGCRGTNAQKFLVSVSYSYSFSYSYSISYSHYIL